MSVKLTCNSGNKLVRRRNLTEFSLCLTMVHLKCNGTNAVDAEIINNTGSDRFWIYMYCFNNLLLFTTVNDHELYQSKKQ